MYSDSDRYLAQVRDVCLAFPEAVEVEAWGRPTFRAGKKMFAVFGTHDERARSLIVRPDPAEREALLADSRWFVPPYFGPSGWLALHLDAAAVDWTEIRELAESSYRQVALKRMLAALDADRG
jgi:hypothetical protein